MISPIKKADPLIFTPEMEAALRDIYADTGNAKITELTGWSEQVLKYQSKKLGLKKTKACKRETVPHATIWTDDMLLFLKDNFWMMTNRQLADGLGLRLTVLRNKTSELGLRRMEKPEPWTDDETAFLVNNYGALSDIEIAEHFKSVGGGIQGKRVWTKKHVCKKRLLLDLHRTPAQLLAIVNRFHLPGGRCDNIATNSASVTLTDNYIVMMIAWRDKDLQKELLKYPELIELKRQEIRLNRAIREVENA